MKSVKPSVDILEGLSNGFNIGRFSVSFDSQIVTVALVHAFEKISRYFFFAPHALA